MSNRSNMIYNKKHQYTTEYKGISSLYFKHLLNVIIRIGDLENAHQRVLDFGSGFGMLKQILMKRASATNVINYDIEPELSDFTDWRDSEFDVIVANEVFYTFEPEELDSLLIEFKNKNINCELIVGISKQSIINNLGKFILSVPDAHKSTKLNPKQELSILLNHMYPISHKSVWFLADVYRLKFRT